VSFDALLLDDLQLWRDDETSRDSFNQPVLTPELVDVVRGRVFALSTFEQRQAIEGTRAVVKRWRVALTYSAAIAAVLDERCTIIDDASGVYEVLEVTLARDAIGPHHFELVVEKVSP
jgi:hypothetical protein